MLTLNTEFADAEVDNRVANLTQSPTFFPEKRPFFLEDAGVFSFGGINNSPLPCFSRWGGVVPGGVPADILKGLKVTGRSGKVDFGVFDTDVDSVGAVDAQHLAVARATVGILNESIIGFIATHGDPRSKVDNNLLAWTLNTATRPLGRKKPNLTGSPGRNTRGLLA